MSLGCQLTPGRTRTELELVNSGPGTHHTTPQNQATASTDLRTPTGSWKACPALSSIHRQRFYNRSTSPLLSNLSLPGSLNTELQLTHPSTAHERVSEALTSPIYIQPTPVQHRQRNIGDNFLEWITSPPSSPRLLRYYITNNCEYLQKKKSTAISNAAPGF